LKRRVIAVLLCMALLTAIGSMVYANQPIKIIVNGQEVKNEPAAIIMDNRTMVPLRTVSEALGAKVEWDDKNRTVRVNVEKELPRVKINGEPTTWPYWIKEGKLYLERRNAIQLVHEGLRHPNHSIAYFPGDSTLSINGKSIPLAATWEGQYQIVNVEYLRDLGIVNFAWDEQDENIMILPR
jgi:hypothetical protein